jgi:uncharacterized membrane protein
MLMSFLFIVLSVVGLGGFCPMSRAPLGVRLTFGWSALTILLTLGAALLALPLRATSFAIAALAAIGLVARARHVFQRDDWKHPAAALGLLAAAVIAIGPGTYIPVAWDELTNWVFLPNQFVVSDRLLGGEIIFNISGYTLGWPLLMAYPQALFDGFDAGRAFPAIVVLHISALALIFDFLKYLGAERGLREPIVTMSAWTVLLALLTAEAMWILFPTLLLIEKPQIYSYVATITLSAWAASAKNETYLRLGLIAGLTFAAAYLFKVAAITLVPALLLAPIILFTRRHYSKAFLLGAILLFPIVITGLWWAQAFPAGDTCRANPILILLNLPQQMEDSWNVVRNLLTLLGSYYAGYKPFISVAALIGFALGFRYPAERLVILVCLVFTASYLVSLALSYIACISDYEREVFISYERFGRVILRVIHTFGLLLLILAAIDWIRDRINIDLSARPARFAFGLALAAFLAWQGVKSYAGLREVAFRQSGNERDETVKEIARGVAHLKSWIEPRTDGTLPRVMMIAQGSTGFELMIAGYHALEALRGGPIRRFIVQGGHSFGPTSTNVWMAAAPPERIRSLAEQADILWSVKLDDYARDALAPILAACPGSSFVVRAGTAWGCPPRR